MASILLGSGTLVSRLLGFVRVIVLAQTIGVVASDGADAFANANALPSAIYAIILGGMLNAVLVPQVVKATKRPDGGQEYINRLVTLAIIVLGGLTLVAMLATPLLAALYAPGLDGRKLGLIIAMAYWCMPQIFLFSMYALVGEVLNARGSFGPYTWAQVINNLVSIGMLVLFGAIFGRDPNGTWQVEDWTPGMIAMLGGTTSLAVAIQLLFLLPFWKKVGLTYRWDTNFRGTGLGEAGRLASWMFGLVVVVQITGIVESMVANLAFGVAGSVAAMNTAFLIFQLPHAIITMSVGTVYFTRMSQAAVDGDHPALIRDFSASTRVIGLFLVLGLVVLAVTSTAFSRVFEAKPVALFSLSTILIAFLIGLPAISMVYLTQRIYYAYEDTRTLFRVYLAVMPLHVILIIGCAMLPVGWIACGLALSQSIVAWVRFAVLATIIRRRIGSLDLGRIVTSYTRFIGGAIVAGLVGILVMWLLGAYRPGGFALSGMLEAIISCILGGIVMLGTYVVALRYLKSPELTEAMGALAGRFGRGGARNADSADAAADDRATEPARATGSARPAVHASGSSVHAGPSRPLTPPPPVRPPHPVRPATTHAMPAFGAPSGRPFEADDEPKPLVFSDGTVLVEDNPPPRPGPQDAHGGTFNPFFSSSRQWPPFTNDPNTTGSLDLALQTGSALRSVTESLPLPTPGAYAHHPSNREPKYRSRRERRRAEGYLREDERPEG